MPRPPPLLSLLVPTLNRRSWLEQCLDSIAPQLTEDCEVLVGNNRSDDDTHSLEERYRHPCIRWFNFAERVPMKQNWQRLLDFAQGKWFILLSDDDRLTSHAVLYLRDRLPSLSHPLDVVIGSTIVNDYGFRSSSYFSNPDIQLTQKSLVHKHLIQGKIALYLCSTVFRREKVISLGGFTNSCFNYAMDWDMVYSLANQGSHILCSSTFLSYYSLHNESATLSRNKELLLEVLRFYKKWIPTAESDTTKQTRLIRTLYQGSFFYFFNRKMHNIHPWDKKIAFICRLLKYTPCKPRYYAILLYTATNNCYMINLFLHLSVTFLNTLKKHDATTVSVRRVRWRKGAPNDIMSPIHHNDAYSLASGLKRTNASSS